MTDAQAAKRARAKWGKNAVWESRLGAADADERAQARERLKELRARREEIDAEIARRLAETPWYVELQAERKAVHAQQDRALGRAHSYRFMVGEFTGFTVCIRGRGDTWEEAFTNAEKPR